MFNVHWLQNKLSSQLDSRVFILANHSPYRYISFPFCRFQMKRKASCAIQKSESTNEEAVSLNVSTPISTSSSSSTKSLIIGTTDFDEILEKEALIIDKTRFIKEFMKDGNKVCVILRPRRFGKSLNLSMLKSFLSLGQHPSKFSQYHIGNEIQLVREHCGKYPVVSLDLKDCKGSNWQEMYKEIWLCICEMVKPHRNDLEKNLQEMREYGIDYKDPFPPFNSAVVQSTLKWLISSLHEKHNKRAVVLVDEYDAPLNHAFRKGFYDEASEFFGSFYSKALKGNSALEKACLMGIVEVRGAGILSGLNNISVYSVADKPYSKHFGFTKSEVIELLELLGTDEAIGDVVDWYDGYQCGLESVINPWSFVNWVKRQEFSSFWVATSNVETISTVLTPHIKSAMEEIFSVLFSSKNERYVVPCLTSHVNYSQSNWEAASILHFLVHTGYLAYRSADNPEFGEVWIPNKEIHKHWHDDVIKLLKTTLIPQFHSRLSSAIQAVPFDVNALESVMKEMLQFCSFHDLTSENSYHLFYYGCLFTILHNGQTIEVSSNKEAGHGRYDIFIKLLELKRVVILEFKKSKSERDLSKDAKRAIQQINQNNYFNELREWECNIVGVAFFGKHMSKPEFQTFQK